MRERAICLDCFVVKSTPRNQTVSNATAVEGWCHCEERSDEAIPKILRLLRPSGSQ